MRNCVAVALICAGFPVASDPPELVEVAKVVLSSDDADFGGLSGLEIAPDGTLAYMLTDRGVLYSLTLSRNQAGHVQDMSFTSKTNLLPRIKDYRPDSEDLALDASGGLFVSLEGPARVAKLRAGEATMNLLPKAPQDKIVKNNRGFEALAIDASGTLFTTPETLRHDESVFPIYAFDGTSWVVSFTVPQNGDFHMVSADFGPDGQLYLLERTFSPLGFRSRISRIDPQQTPRVQQVLLNSRLGKYDNLEGLSVWQDPSGTLRIAAVSDDNFLAIQEQHLVEFVLKE